MLADKNPVVDQAVSSIWYLSEDKKIRDEIWRREDNELIQRSIDEDLAKYEQLKKDSEKLRQDNEILTQKYDKSQQEADKYKQDNERLIQESKEKDAEILRLKKELEESKK